MNQQPFLQTERLILRPFTLDDVPDVQRLCGDFAIADTTLNIPHPYPEGAAAEFISRHPDAFAERKHAVFALTLKDTGELIGGAGLHDVSPRFNRAEAGYWVARAHWNQGYATEALRAVVAFGFSYWQLHKIVATHLKRNPASGRVMEKAGFVQEGVLRDHVLKWDRFEDIVTCGIIQT